jgi:tRNA-dihydrouridine synthase B
VQLLDSVPEEKPLSVQLFGSNPPIMADAARIVQDSGADIVDINFGCSVKKILKSNSGSALMKDPPLAGRILESVRKACYHPLDHQDPIRLGAVREAGYGNRPSGRDCGVDAIAVHPRTATQGFRGEADWSIIAAVKKALTIPVIGNGDVTTPEDALRMLDETGCDGVMVGRAAIGNPMIFVEFWRWPGSAVAVPNDAQRIDMMIGYLQDSVRYLGEKTACRMMRSRLCWFVKGMRNAGQFRNAIRFIASEKEATDLIQQYAASIS